MLLADLPNRAQRTTRYFYGGESQWQVCAERGAFSQITATYVYGNYIDEVLQMQRCESTPPCTSTPPADYYYHTDDLYNVMAVTDDAGNVVERYEYDDYGTPMIMAPDGTALTSSPIANPYLFTGRRHDPETGWYHYRTRYLDPQSGRFTTRDTIGIWGDPWELGNGYTYVGNGPLSWLDWLGLSVECDSLRDQVDRLERQMQNLDKLWNASELEIARAKENLAEAIAREKAARDFLQERMNKKSSFKEKYVDNTICEWQEHPIKAPVMFILGLKFGGTTFLGHPVSYCEARNPPPEEKLSPAKHNLREARLNRAIAANALKRLLGRSADMGEEWNNLKYDLRRLRQQLQKCEKSECKARANQPARL